ncbi:MULTISPECIES: sugar ABC transporter substrate-binding protein [unclassified Pseudomonas]|uniref:sugar ABC transporter substrate-binding protein n=1 Tax=unclassified Pseudomonas TaxID=196821 RepID=UPI00131B8342|nr:MULTISPECIES: sugar ABC transporter substrate-binding protein [unclassified Pseudomonas]
MPCKPHLTALAVSLLLASTSVLADLKIGVSMPTFDDNYLTYLRENMSKKAKQGGISLQFEDARNDVVKQLNQVQSFISQKVDAVIVNPVDTAATRNLIESASKAGIPLVFVNRKPDDAKLPAGVVTVTSNDREAGHLQAQYIADKLGGKGQVAILLGELSNNSTQVRTAGFKEILGKYPGIKIVEEQTGMWLRDKGMDLTSNWLLAGKEIDGILSNNDEMAIGAAMALKQAGKQGVLVGGVDGTPDALAAIKRGLMSVSVYQDARGQAEGALNAAEKLAKKENVEQNVTIPYRLITPENVAEFQAMLKQ